MHRWQIKLVANKVMKDYEGMNHYAAKALGFKPIPSKNTILVNKSYKGNERKRIIQHEEKEAQLMSKHWHYWPAHLHALKSEKKVR